jgi:hypothetical protein
LSTYDNFLTGALLAVVVIGIPGLVQGWRTPEARNDPDRPAVAAVFTVAPIDEPGFDQRIRPARLRYGVTAGATIGGALGYEGYLRVVNEGNRGGPVYYAGFAGQVVTLGSLYAIGFVSYPLVVRVRLRKVGYLHEAGVATLDVHAVNWLSRQRRLLALDAWLGVVTAVSSLPVLGNVIVSVFAHHRDPQSPLPRVVIAAVVIAFLPVLLDSATVARRIPWSDWVFDGSVTAPQRAVARQMYQGILIGLLAALVGLAAAGWIVGSSDPIHTGPADPGHFSPPPRIQYTADGDRPHRCPSFQRSLRSLTQPDDQQTATIAVRSRQQSAARDRSLARADNSWRSNKIKIPDLPRSACRS